MSGTTQSVQACLHIPTPAQHRPSGRPGCCFFTTQQLLTEKQSKSLKWHFLLLWLMLTAGSTLVSTNTTGVPQCTTYMHDCQVQLRGVCCTWPSWSSIARACWQETFNNRLLFCLLSVVPACLPDIEVPQLCSEAQYGEALGCQYHPGLRSNLARH